MAPPITPSPKRRCEVPAPRQSQPSSSSGSGPPSSALAPPSPPAPVVAPLLVLLVVPLPVVALAVVTAVVLDDVVGTGSSSVDVLRVKRRSGQPRFTSAKKYSAPASKS